MTIDLFCIIQSCGVENRLKGWVLGKDGTRAGTFLKM